MLDNERSFMCLVSASRFTVIFLFLDSSAFQMYLRGWLKYFSSFTEDSFPCCEQQKSRRRFLCLCEHIFLKTSHEIVIAFICFPWLLYLSEMILTCSAVQSSSHQLIFLADKREEVGLSIINLRN